MSDLDQLTRIVLALPDPALRVAWVDEKLRTSPPASFARLIDRLCEQSERSDPQAREALLSVALAFAQLGNAPELDRLRDVASAERLLALDRLLRRAPPPPERVTDIPVPDYGAGRELTLGERRSLARRPDRRMFEKLLADPHPLVIRQLLENPKLTEDDVVRLCARRPAKAFVMRALARFPRWMSKSRVRRTILLNPGSPPEIAVPLVCVSTRTELVELAHSADTSLVLRAIALELLERRPPLPKPDPGELVQ